MSIGVGFSLNKDAGEAAAEIAKSAKTMMGEDDKGAWALAMVGGGQDCGAFLKHLRAELEGIPIIGGEIDNNWSDEAKTTFYLTEKIK